MDGLTLVRKPGYEATFSAPRVFVAFQNNAIEQDFLHFGQRQCISLPFAFSVSGIEIPLFTYAGSYPVKFQRMRMKAATGDKTMQFRCIYYRGW